MGTPQGRKEKGKEEKEGGRSSPCFSSWPGLQCPSSEHQEREVKILGSRGQVTVCMFKSMQREDEQRKNKVIINKAGEKKSGSQALTHEIPATAPTQQASLCLPEHQASSGRTRHLRYKSSANTLTVEYILAFRFLLHESGKFC